MRAPRGLRRPPRLVPQGSVPAAVMLAMADSDSESWQIGPRVMPGTYGLSKSRT